MHHAKPMIPMTLLALMPSLMAQAAKRERAEYEEALRRSREALDRAAEGFEAAQRATHCMFQECKALDVALYELPEPAIRPRARRKMTREQRRARRAAKQASKQRRMGR